MNAKRKALLATTVLFVSALLASLNANADEIQFQIQHDGQCTGQPCDTNFTYSVYVQGGTVPLVTSDSSPTPAVPFAIDLGTEYCFEATASNSAGESNRSPVNCTTWVSQPPSAPIILSIPAVFSGN